MYRYVIKDWTGNNFIVGGTEMPTLLGAFEEFKASHWVGSTRPKFIAEDDKIIATISDDLRLTTVTAEEQLTVKLPKYK